MIIHLPSPADFRAWQLSHYAERLAAEKDKGNNKAVSFLRNQLHNLKK